MSCDERRLVRHLTWAVIGKLALLGALWWFFVRDQPPPSMPDRSPLDSGSPLPGREHMSDF